MKPSKYWRTLKSKVSLVPNEPNKHKNALVISSRSSSEPQLAPVEKPRWNSLYWAKKSYILDRLCELLLEIAVRNEN